MKYLKSVYSVAGTIGDSWPSLQSFNKPTTEVRNVIILRRLFRAEYSSKTPIRLFCPTDEV